MKKFITIISGLSVLVFILLKINNLSVSLVTQEAVNEITCDSKVHLKTIDLSEFKQILNSNNDTSIFVIWTTWCSNSKKHVPRILERYKEQGNVHLVNNDPYRQTKTIKQVMCSNFNADSGYQLIGNLGREAAILRIEKLVLACDPLAKESELGYPYTLVFVGDSLIERFKGFNED